MACYEFRPLSIAMFFVMLNRYSHGCLMFWTIVICKDTVGVRQYMLLPIYAHYHYLSTHYIWWWWCTNGGVLFFIVSALGVFVQVVLSFSPSVPFSLSESSWLLHNSLFLHSNTRSANSRLKPFAFYLAYYSNWL